MGEEQIKEPVEMPETMPEDASALKQMLEQERAKSAEYLDNWRRAAADFSNYKKRIEKENAELAKFSNSMLIARLLPVLDDFDRAFQTIPDNLSGLTWINGVMLIARKMQAVLESEGLKPIDAANKEFDPNLHEAVIHEETDQFEDGIVMTELQNGYKLGELVLCPTMVKVAKKKT